MRKAPNLMTCSDKPPSQKLTESPETHDPYLELLSLSNYRLCFVLKVEGHWRIQRPNKEGF